MPNSSSKSVRFLRHLLWQCGDSDRSVASGPRLISCTDHRSCPLVGLTITSGIDQPGRANQLPHDIAADLGTRSARVADRYTSSIPFDELLNFSGRLSMAEGSRSRGRPGCALRDMSPSYAAVCRIVTCDSIDALSRKSRGISRSGSSASLRAHDRDMQRIFSRPERSHLTHHPLRSVAVLNAQAAGPRALFCPRVSASRASSSASMRDRPVHPLGSRG